MVLWSLSPRVQLEALERVVLDVPFLLMTEVLSSSPWPVLLATSALQLAPALSEAPAATASQLTGGAAPPTACRAWLQDLTARL